jgi:hypothetical protein
MNAIEKIGMKLCAKLNLPSILFVPGFKYYYNIKNVCSTCNTNPIDVLQRKGGVILEERRITNCVCGLVSYCSEECREADYINHEEFCHGARNSDSDDEDEPVHSKLFKALLSNTPEDKLKQIAEQAMKELEHCDDPKIERLTKHLYLEAMFEIYRSNTGNIDTEVASKIAYDLVKITQNLEGKDDSDEAVYAFILVYALLRVDLTSVMEKKISFSDFIHLHNKTREKFKSVKIYSDPDKIVDIERFELILHELKIEACRLQRDVIGLTGALQELMDEYNTTRNYNSSRIDYYVNMIPHYKDEFVDTAHIVQAYRFTLD